MPEGVTVNYDPSTGLYTITVAKTVKDGFALKAAHAELPAPTDTPGSPVLPANPAVQDAHALPQTGTSLFAALAMALSGFALTIAGAWASLLGKNNRH